jgi:hypothetical protein
MPTNMHKKPRRDNRAGRELSTVHTAGDQAALLLQRIKQRARLEITGESASRPAPESCLQQLRAALPESLRPHLVGVIEKSEGLTLLADSAVWAGRLKLALPDLAVAAGHRPMIVRLDPGAGAGTRRNARPRT